jgi:hypothetical protein
MYCNTIIELARLRAQVGGAGGGAVGIDGVVAAGDPANTMDSKVTHFATASSFAIIITIISSIETHRGRVDVYFCSKGARRILGFEGKNGNSL